MTTRFLEPGTNATYDLSFWNATVGAVSSSTDTARNGNARSLKINVTNSQAAYARRTNIYGAISGRCSFYFRLSSLPTSTDKAYLFHTRFGAPTDLWFAVGSSGEPIIGTGDTTALATGSASTIAINTWRRACLAWDTSGPTSFTINLYLDGVLVLSASSGTLTAGTSGFNAGDIWTGNTTALAAFGGSYTHYISDLVCDDNLLGSTADTGDLNLATKQPASLGTNQFNLASISSPRWDNVDERPLSEGNTLTDTQGHLQHTETFGIQAAGAGDQNLTSGPNFSGTLVSRLDWVWAKKSADASGITAGNTSSASGGGSTGATGTTLVIPTFSNNDGQVVVVVFADQVGGSTPTIADAGGNTWTLLAGPTTNTVRKTAWYAKLTASTGAITITFGSSAGSRAAVARAFTYVDTSSPLDKNPTDLNDSTSPYAAPASGTLSNANEVVIGTYALAGPGEDTVAAGAGDTLFSAGSQGIKRIGSVSAQSRGNPSITTITTGALTTVAGDLIVLNGADRVGSGTFVITDSKGNTVTTLNATTNTVRMTPAYIVVASGKEGSTTYTATFSSSNLAVSLVATQFRGFTSTPKDVNPTNVNITSTTAYASPDSGTLAQADELVVGLFAAGVSGAFSASGSTTGVDSVNTSGTTSTAAAAGIGYQFVTATTSVTNADATQTSSSGVAGIVSFKAVNGRAAESIAGLTHRFVSSTSSVAPSMTDSTANRTGVTGTATFKQAATSTGTLVSDGVDNSITLTTTSALNFVITDTSSYPTGTLGMKSCGPMADTTFFEAGSIFAYIPGPANNNEVFLTNAVNPSAFVRKLALPRLFEQQNLLTSTLASAVTTVNVTGVSATGSVGTVTENFDYSNSVTGVNATGSVGSVTENFDYSNSVTGVSATGSVGTSSVTLTHSESTTGVSATGSVGTSTVTLDHTESAAGVSATGSVGSVTENFDYSNGVTGVSATGSVGSVTENFDYSNSVTGVSVTGSVGNATVTLDHTENLTGVSATGSVGSVTENFDYSISVTGLSATGSVGSVTENFDYSISVTGLSATGSVGSVTENFDYSNSATGVSATGSIGNVTENFDYSNSVTGVSATGSLGTTTLAIVSTDYLRPPLYINRRERNLPIFKLQDTNFSINLNLVSGSTSVNVTGVSATGSVGTATVNLGHTENATGVSATGSVGTVTVNYDYALSVTGVSATGSVGTATVSTSSSTTVDVSGVEATGSVGTVTENFDYSNSVTGVSATGQTGTVVAGSDVSVSVTGVSATGQLGTLTENFDYSNSVTGVSATGEVGTVATNYSASVSVSGVSATGQTGTVAITNDLLVTVIGVSATGQTGTVTENFDYANSVTGVGATGSVGTVTENFDYADSVTGVTATGQTGTTTVILSANVSATGVSAIGEIGTVTTRSDATVSVSGVSATGSVGTVATNFDAAVTLTGTAATGSVGTVSAIVGAVVQVTGLQAAGQLGTVSTAYDYTLAVTGVQAIGSVGDANISVSNSADLSGVSATGSVGDVFVQDIIVVNVSGVSAFGQTGNLATGSDAFVSVNGVEAFGSVGDISLRIRVDVPFPEERLFVIPAEPRVYTIAEENRIAAVVAELRTYSIVEENRTLGVTFENRLFDIPNEPRTDTV